MSTRSRWLLVAAAAVGCAGLTACGTSSPPAGAGRAASISMSLRTVPTIRSVTVTPDKATFGDCSGGSAGADTASTTSRLGYPNGHCWYGRPGPNGVFPITITNTGIASAIDVSGSSADPADDGDQWNLCNIGQHPVVACTGGRQHSEPGTDQYLIKNFSPDNSPDRSGLTSNPACDHQFNQSGGCVVPQGAFQTEGIELIGPSASTDNSTRWTVTITWMPVPQ